MRGTAGATPRRGRSVDFSPRHVRSAVFAWTEVHATKQARAMRRRGATLVLVLVALGIALVLCGGLLQLALRQRRLVERQHREAQAAWLVEAGIERAAASLAADPSYAGETWAVPAEQLPTGAPAEVRIAVAPSAENAAARIIDVTADYPAGTDLRARRSKRIEWVASEGDGP